VGHKKIVTSNRLTGGRRLNNNINGKTHQNFTLRPKALWADQQQTCDDNMKIMKQQKMVTSAQRKQEELGCDLKELGCGSKGDGNLQSSPTHYLRIGLFSEEPSRD
jgi:hypothetical protein